MRIPFPERVNLTHALIFATGLSSIQILQGTNPFFSGCVFCFILVASFAFNLSGGLAFPSGAFIFFNAIFTIILPCVAKAIIGDPADAFLRAPLRTVEIYLAGMLGLLVAVLFSRRFRKRKAYIADMLPVGNLRAGYIGSAVFSVIIIVLLNILPGGGNGSINSFLIQIDRFPLLTLVLGVIYTVHRTQGRRSVSWPLLGMIMYISLGAFFSFSKEQLLSPIFAWAITVALLGYRLNWLNIAVFILGTFFVVTYMVPYAAYGRGFVAPNMSRTQISMYLLTHMDEVREGYASSIADYGGVRFYDHNRGLLTRLEVFSVDDALVNVTDREGTFGFTPVMYSFENLVPHVLWPNKPNVAFGNDYAHEVGVIPDEDFSTGVSFSPSVDAYHEGRMLGVLVVEPLVFMLVFWILDSVIGDVRANPVGLLTTILVARAASEGALFGGAYLIAQPLFSNVLAALVCAYVLPILGYAFAKTPLDTAAVPRPPRTPSPSMPQPVTTL